MITRVDENTRALLVVDYAHHEIHVGSHFYTSGFTTLATDGTLYIKLVTPNTLKDMHFMWQISSSGICETWLDEEATGGMTGGSNVIPLNNNRNFPDNSGILLTSGVTINTGQSAVLDHQKWGAAGFKTTIGGGSARDDEVVLRRNTTYLRAFKSHADDNIIQFKASWYEHASKEEGAYNI